MEDRRGFLKTLGKLGAAVGLTAAVTATAKPTIPTTPKARIDTTPKAKMKGGFSGFKKPAYTHASNSHTVSNRDKLRGGLNWGQGSPTAEAQRAIDAIENLRLDNLSMEMHPPVTYVPQHVYDFIHRKEAIRNLDPYNWGKVFDLKWHDWRADNPRYATVCGWWSAEVKPQFRGIFESETFCQKQEIAMQYLVQARMDHDRIKEVAKDQCYRQLVDKLQDVILARIKRDVKSST